MCLFSSTKQIALPQLPKLKIEDQLLTTHNLATTFLNFWAALLWQRWMFVNIFSNLSEVSEWRPDKNRQTYLQLKRENELWVQISDLHWSKLTLYFCKPAQSGQARSWLQTTLTLKLETHTKSEVVVNTIQMKHNFTLSHTKKVPDEKLKELMSISNFEDFINSQIHVLNCWIPTLVWIILRLGGEEGIYSKSRW